MGTRTCKYCNEPRDEEQDFYKGNKSRCIVCVRALTLAHKERYRELQRQRLEELSQAQPSTVLYPCPICKSPCVGGQGLLSHFKAEHTITDGGRYDGLVAGLDVVPCLLCGKHRIKMLYGHLRSDHGLDQRAYLNQFPQALVYVMAERDLAKGKVRWTVPQKHPRRDQTGRTQKPVTEARYQVCPICRVQSDGLSGHFARKHPELARVPIFEAFTGGSVEASNEELLVGSILATRRERDISSSWLVGETHLYFIQAGGPKGPIKIGFSADVAERVQSVQTGCPARLHVLATHIGKQEDEEQLHRLFNPFHMSGEWFKPHPILLEYILGLNRQAAGQVEQVDPALLFESDTDRKRFTTTSEAERFHRTLKFIEAQVAVDAGVDVDVLYGRLVAEYGEHGIYGDRDVVGTWAERIRNPRGHRKKDKLIQIGDVFGHLKVIAFDGLRPDPRKVAYWARKEKRDGTNPKHALSTKCRYWKCRCTACNKETAFTTSDLRSGLYRSCGCLGNNKKRKQSGFKSGNEYGFKPKVQGPETEPTADLLAALEEAANKVTPHQNGVLPGP